MDNSEFINFLYEKKLEGLKQQIIYVDNKKRMFWYPSNKEKKNVFQPKKTQLVGFTGRCYLSYNDPQHSQPYQVCWAGIDIDDYNDANFIHNLLPEATIRASKSNTGLHLFFRFEKVLIKSGVMGNIIKPSLKPYVDILENAGLKKFICKWDGNVFYVISKNNQEVFFKSEAFIKFTVSKENFVFYNSFKEEGEIDEENLTPRGEMFVSFLRSHELIGEILPRKKGVYIKEWYEVLNNSGVFKISTKSPMTTPSAHNNGFMCVEDGVFKLYACADSRFIFSYPILKGS
jgi:hypothetical protein